MLEHCPNLDEDVAALVRRTNDAITADETDDDG